MYENAVCASASDVMHFLNETLLNRENDQWSLVYHDLTGAGGITLTHNTETVAYAFSAHGPNSYWGRHYSSGWPGIDARLALSGSNSHVSYPVKAHLILVDTLCLIVLQNVSNNRCYLSGGGISEGVGQWQGINGVWGSAGASRVYWGDPLQIPFLSSGDDRASANSTGLSIFNEEEGVWYGNVGLSPALLSVLQYPGAYTKHDMVGLYRYDELPRMLFPTSATTLFMPALLCRNIDGYKPAATIPRLRACTPAYFGVGDTVEYQGNTWVIFPVRDADKPAIAVRITG